jgi:hypothetical protein
VAEVVVEQMHGSDRVSEPEGDYERAWGWMRTIHLGERNGALSRVHGVMYLQSGFADHWPRTSEHLHGMIDQLSNEDVFYSQ